MSARNRQRVDVAAVLVSQHTSLAVLGMKPRTFLEWLPKSGLRIIARGKDRLVFLDEAVRVLAASARQESGTFDPQPESADAVLAALGRRTTRGVA